MARCATIVLLGVGLWACAEKSPPEPVCQAGAFECMGTTLRICNAAGSAWQNGACAENQACVRGDCADPMVCPDACREIICTPGQRFCGQDERDNYLVYECDETGTTPLSCGSCAADPVNGVCLSGECIAVCGIAQKSYIGCDYYGADLDNAFVFSGFDAFGQANFLDAAGAQFAMVVSNPHPSSSAFVSVLRGPVSGTPPAAVCVQSEPDSNVVMTAIVPPRGVKILELPRRDVNATVKAKLAYRLASNIPITVYQFNPLENENVFSNDASVLLPTNAVGNEYYIMTRAQTFPNLRGFLTIIGIQPQPTEVTVTVSARTYPGVGIAALLPGEQITVSLEQYEVLSLATDAIGADLTGSHVIADKPVVVFGGSEAANAPSTSTCDLDTMKCAFDQVTSCECTDGDGPLCTPDSKCSQFITCCADHLEQQLLPISAWGTEYVAVRSFPRGKELDIWRVLAAHEDTEITLHPPVATVPTLGPGQWFEFESGDDFTISSSAPIMVGQFLAAEHAPNPGVQPGDAGIGDPAFILGVPVRQFRSEYVFLAPNKYELDYVSIAARATSEVRLDGHHARTAPDARLANIPDTDWQAIRVPIGDGFHELICTEPCAVMVHGYDSYVSYGYPGGLNLDDEQED